MKFTRTTTITKTERTIVRVAATPPIPDDPQAPEPGEDTRLKPLLTEGLSGNESTGSGDVAGADLKDQ